MASVVGGAVNAVNPTGSDTFAQYPGILVPLAYDRLVEFALRPQLVFRQFVDKHPTDVTQPGTTIRLSLWNDLAPSLSGSTIMVPGAAGAPNYQNFPTAGEITDPDPVVLAAQSFVDLTLGAYGRTVVLTKTLIQQAITDIDQAAVNMIAWDMANTMELAIEPVLRAGTNRLGPTTTPKALATITATDTFSSHQIRRAVSLMRQNYAPPLKEQMFGCLIHPAQSFDLRSETGGATWREPHVYNATGNIWNGEVGGYEGAFFVESPRCYQFTDGAASAKVTRALLFGRQALAEAVTEEPHLLWGPVTDPLMRKQPLSWYGVLGWAIYRQNSLYRLESGTTF